MSTMTSADAKAFARLQHSGQTDKGGMPYIEHLERVAYAAERRAVAAHAAGLPIEPDLVTQAAWLHDVIEDTPTTGDELRQQGFVDAVVEMVLLLTKPPGHASYEERINAIIASGNLGAILVKLSDNEDNANPDRPLHSAHTLPARYAASMLRLRRAAEGLGYTGP